MPEPRSASFLYCPQVLRLLSLNMIALSSNPLNWNLISTVEHMLFMGSEKYPQEDHYERFLGSVRLHNSNFALFAPLLTQIAPFISTAWRNV